MSQGGELIINDDPNCNESTTQVCDSIAFVYLQEYIETPIKNHLNSTVNQSGDTLKNVIRYIVLCKGIPHKIRSGHIWLGLYGEWAHRTRINVSVDALLCLINNDEDIVSLYNNPQTPVQPPLPCSTSIFCGYDPIGGNPYRNVDPGFSFNYRFMPNHFETNNGWKLNYLVSRLDGHNLGEVKKMIDRSVNPDYSGQGVWILDGHSFMYGYMSTVNSILDNWGFNTEYDETLNPIIQHQDLVIGYSSGGFNAGMQSLYIHNDLEFEYKNGAVFNTFESFNAWAMDTSFRSSLGLIHGLVSEWVLERNNDSQTGTGGAGHTWEPFIQGMTREYIFFPSYAMGYGIVDAAYQGITYLGWQNVVVGDPLTTIAWGKQELTQNLTWSERNLVTGEISIPVDRILTIEDSSYIELRHQGFIPCEVGYGRMYIGENVTFETDDWDRALFLSYDTAYTRLVWADHPTFAATNYIIYRKFNDLDWESIASTFDNEYIDTEVEITCTECATNATVYYYVIAGNEQEQYSDPSNTVSGEVIAKLDKELAQREGRIYSYGLEQNYPNPFNPTTTIKYSLRDDGIVSLKVYNILGSEIAELVNEQKSAGEYSATFDFSNLASGTYFYVLRVNDFVDVKKMVLLK